MGWSCIIYKYTPTYCDAFTTSAQDEYIGNVTCGSINNTTGWQSGVANYTAISTAIAAGSSEAIAVTNSGGAYGTSDYVTVWVDWGADFVFDQGGDEEFLLTNDGTGINFLEVFWCRLVHLLALIQCV